MIEDLSTGLPADPEKLLRFNSGYDSLSFHFSLRNEVNEISEWYLDFRRKDHVRVVVDYQNPDRPNDYLVTGFDLPNHEKQLGIWNVVRVRLPPGETAKFTIKVYRSFRPIRGLMIVRSSQKWAEYISNKMLFDALFIGGFLMMLIFSLLIYLQSKYPPYLYLALYLLAMTLITLLGTGIFFTHFLTEHGFVARYMIILPFPIAVIYWQFLRHVVDIKGNFPLIYKVFKDTVVLNIFAFLAGVLLFIFGAKYVVIAWMTLVVFLFTIILSSIFLVYMYIRKKGPFSYFITGTIFLLAGFIFELASLDFADDWGHISRLGQLIHILFFALGVGEKTKMDLNQSNEQLEKMVSRRTSELQQANEELKKVLSNLQKAKMKLIESEKMASIGMLTSGIGHEIGNPMNYVSGNVRPMRRDIAEIAQLLAQIEKLRNELEKTQAGSELLAFMDEGQFNFLMTEINELMDGVEEGSNRVKKLITSLKSFSRKDEEHPVDFDLKQSLESTIRLIQPTVRHRIAIHNHLSEEGMVINAIPGEINQVFLNILDNATHAISEEGDIWVRNLSENGHVEITIEDNGTGIPKDVADKVFEPFFTTKPIGTGTGLGLAMCQQIIIRNHGSITFESTEHVGTSFKISFPHV